MLWGHALLLDLYCPRPWPYPAMEQGCRVQPGNARCRALLAPWPRQHQAGLSYLTLSCCSDLPGGLRSAASSLLQFGKASVIDTLGPAVPPGQHSSSAGTAVPPTLGISLWAKSSPEAQSPKTPALS